MSDNALVIFFVICVYLIVFAYTFQIQTKHQIQIQVMHFCDFQSNYKYTKFLYSNTITNMYLNPTLLHIYYIAVNVSQIIFFLMRKNIPNKWEPYKCAKHQQSFRLSLTMCNTNRLCLETEC